MVSNDRPHLAAQQAGDPGLNKSRPPAQGRVVALTGAFGFLGRRLIRRLERDPTVQRIVAIDIRDPMELARREGESTEPATFLKNHGRISAHNLDLTLAGSATVLSDILRAEEVDTVCHLAFLSNPSHAEELAHELETIGTMYVLNAAKAAGVKRLSSLSTTMLYGARSDNPAWLRETDPLRSRSANLWLRDKADAEEQVRRFAEATPECAVSILRMGLVLGGGSRNFWSRYFHRSRVPTVLGFDPLVQVLHAEDAAEGLYATVMQGPRGLYHLVGRGVLPLSNVIRGLGKRSLPLPASAGSALLSSLWQAQLIEIPPSFLDYVRWSWVADGAQLREAVGFVPSLNTAEAVRRTRADQTLAATAYDFRGSNSPPRTAS